MRTSVGGGWVVGDSELMALECVGFVTHVVCISDQRSYC